MSRLREAFQSELSGVIDKLVTVAVGEADAAAERARAAGQTALEAARTELEQRGRQSHALTESVRHLEGQVDELRAALQGERERMKAAQRDCEQERTARARAEAAGEEAHRLHERLVSEYESHVQAAHAQIDAARGQIVALKRKLASEVSERVRLLTALKTVQQTCVLAQANAERFGVAGASAEEDPHQETTSDVHGAPVATLREGGADGHDASAELDEHEAATSHETASSARRNQRSEDPLRQPAIEIPPSLAKYAKPLFPRATVGRSKSGGAATLRPRS